MLEVTEREKLPVQQARAGDGEAWNTLFRRYQMPLYVYVVELVRNEQTSLDIVQETFVSAMRHLHSLQQDEKFGSWLFSIAHQKCIQLWRKQSRENDAMEEIADAPLEFEVDPRERLIRREEESGFLELLDKLPLPQRSVVLLFFVEEFSLEQIAQITGTSVGTIKSRLHYAKKRLRELWKEKVA